MPIHFDSVTREAQLLSPLQNFEAVSQTIEHRRDPLTYRRVIVLKGRLDYVKRFIDSDERVIEALTDSTQQTCPFCPASVQTKSPKFVPEISTEGRIHVGDAICFPSLFAHEDYNAVVVPTPSHRIALNQMQPAMFVDAFKACIEYFRRVNAWQPAVKHTAIVMNYYPPAGSTLAHPHLQALGSDLPLPTIDSLVQASRLYFQKNGSSYWAELIDEERRRAERYLGTLGEVCWLTPFAPLGLNEVQAIAPHASNLTSLSDELLQSLAEGLVRVLGYYYDTGVRSFNMAIYSAPFGENLDYFDVGLRVVSRYGYKANFVSDVWALQYLLGGQEIYEAPEETCSKLRKYFE